MSKINLQRGKLTVENRKSRERKQICSEVSVNSPGNQWSQLQKKGDLKQCANYTTIALVSHASKILLRIILERIRVKTETEIADEQAGFRQGRGTRDQIMNLRILMHKAREH